MDERDSSDWTLKRWREEYFVANGAANLWNGRYDRLQRGIAAVHRPGPRGSDGRYCVTCCAERWPCRTFALLDGES